MWMGEWNSDYHNYYCGQESFRINGRTLIVNKNIQNAVLGGNLKNDIMISVCYEDKSCKNTLIQVYVLTTNVKDAEAY